jgi:chromosome segregation ATPase
MAQSHDDTTELKAIQAELDAKTSLIKSLRTDAERSQTLEDRLDEKRATIGELEKSLDSQAATIAELKDSVRRWKDRYGALKSAHDIADSMISTMPDVVARVAAGDADSDAETVIDKIAERTVAINMRDALQDARDAADTPKKENKATAS